MKETETGGEEESLTQVSLKASGTYLGILLVILIVVSILIELATHKIEHVNCFSSLLLLPTYLVITDSETISTFHSCLTQGL